MDIVITQKDALKIATILGIEPCLERKLVLTRLEVQRLREVSKKYPDKSLRVYAKHSGIGFNTFVSIAGIAEPVEITDYDSW